MKKFFLIAILFLLVAAAPFSRTLTASAAPATDEETAPAPEELVDELDLTALEECFSSMNAEGAAFFGTDIKEYIKRAVRGEVSFGYDGFLRYILSMVGVSLQSVIPLMLSVIAVAVVVSFVGGMRGGFGSSAVGSIVDFAGVALASALVLAEVFGVIRRTAALITALRVQMEAVFPVLFTLMTALGASGSIAIYRPAVAVLAFSVTELVSAVALPMLIASLAFSVVGNLSDGVKLDGMTKFITSAAKWVMYTSFFLFLAFLSVQGITAAVYDSVSVRSAKFALSKYVPVIGGYLSEGFNMILAGTVLIKNAVGMTAVMLALSAAVPVLLEVITTSLALRLAGAITEPIEGGRICKLLGSVSSSVNLLIAVIAGMVFLYVVFLVLVIAGGNLAL